VSQASEAGTPGEAGKPGKPGDEGAPRPLQRFRARFVGEYFGSPNPNAPKAPGRRLVPTVYRIEARDVVLLEGAPDAPSTTSDPAGSAGAEAAPEIADRWQAQIDEAHLPHVLGPGTAYRGPVFDVQLQQIRLSFPIEHGGRAYGRIEGSLQGAFPMPDKPAIPVVKVTEKRVHTPKAAPTMKPLEATLSVGEPAPTRSPRAPLASHASPAPRAEEGVRAPSAGLRGLAAFIVLVGAALAVQSGAGYAAFWALCALPMLPLRWMFHEMVRPSAFVHATAFVACLGSIACALLVVHAFRECAPLPWWPGLLTLLLLVPLAPMPSPLPAVAALLSLALIVGLFSARTHRAPCAAPHAGPKHAGLVQVRPGTESASPNGLCRHGGGGQIGECASTESLPLSPSLV